MPLYDYRCKKCNHIFEALVLGSKKPVCESCGALDLERLLSLPTVQSESTRGLAMKAAQRRDKAQATDQMHERLKYEQSHDRHG